MRVLLPLNNNQSASAEKTKKRSKCTKGAKDTVEDETSSGDQERRAHREDEAESGIDSASEEEQDLGEPEISAEEEVFQIQTSIDSSRKRNHGESSQSATSTGEKENSVPKSTAPVYAKRSKVATSSSVETSISDDSKPPAKPMVAPKQLSSSPSDHIHEDPHEPDSHWEENEPTPFGNMQHYYRNHPRNNLRLISTTPTVRNQPHESSSTVAAAAAISKNGDNPKFVGEDDGFIAALKSAGLEIVEQEGDGNCLFRAVSLQVYGDAGMHGQVREQCLDFMALNKEHFGQFMTADEPFESYIARKRQLGAHGNNPEIQAISELFNRPVQIFSPDAGAKPLNIFHKDYATTDEPIRLSYHDNNHYNAVVDPTNPTAGLGLGLPGLQPGLADKLQVAAARTESDIQSDMEQAITASQKDYSKYNDDQLQRVLKESSFSMDSLYQNKAITLSDVDATNFELEQTILETSLQSYYSSKQEDEGRKQRASPAGRRRRPQASAPCPNNDGPDHQFSLTAGTGQPPVAAAAAVATPASPEHHASFASVSSSSPHMSSQAAAHSTSDGQLPSSADEYPSVVHELVMNGFDLKKVVHAYELVGDKFDDLLAFLMSTGAS